MDLRGRMGADPSETALGLDRKGFLHAFGRESLAFDHHLAGCEGFDADAVAEFAARVPSSWSRPHSGRLPLLFPEKVRVTSLTTAEVVRTIGHNDQRLTIYFLERVQPYRTFMQQILREIADLVGPREGGVSGTSLSFFLASPSTVVQSHFDRHHNLLLQLDGTKEITVGNFEDPIDDQRAIERARRLDHNNLSELPTRTRTFVLGPGDGLYIPPYAFHWVHGGSDVSVALSYAFATPATLRTPAVYWCNANLRRFGLRPRPPGSSERRDRAKVFAITQAGRLRDAIVSRRGRRGRAGPASAR